MSVVEFHRLIIITPNYQKLNRSLSEIVWHSFHLHVHCINKNAAVVSVSEHSNIIGTRPKVQELNDQSCCYKMAGSKPFNCQVIIIIGIGACVWRNQVISEQFLVKIVGFTLKVWRTELLKKQNKCLDQNRKIGNPKEIQEFMQVYDIEQYGSQATQNDSMTVRTWKSSVF